MPQPPEKLMTCLCNHNKMLFFPPKGYWAQQRRPPPILSVTTTTERMLGGSGSKGVTVADGVGVSIGVGRLVTAFVRPLASKQARQSGQ